MMRIPYTLLLVVAFAVCNASRLVARRADVPELACGKFVCQNVDPQDEAALKAIGTILTNEVLQNKDRYRTGPTKCAQSAHDVAFDVFSNACDFPQLEGWWVENIISDLPVSAPSGRTYILTCENATMFSNPERTRSYGFDFWGAEDQGIFRLKPRGVRGGLTVYGATVPITIHCANELWSIFDDPTVPRVDQEWIRNTVPSSYSDPDYRLAFSDDVPPEAPPRLRVQIHCPSHDISPVGSSSPDNATLVPGMCSATEPSFPIRGMAGSSIDPNDKVGSTGFGVSHYVSGKEPLRYVLFFENQPSATLAAQQVTITDQLDLNALDLSTFALGSISFGNVLITPPPGLISFATDVDLRPGNNVFVRIQASLDSGTGLVTWRFTSLDPATGQPPQDPLVGFLPPNVTPPQGDGAVLFTVRPKSTVGTNTQIRNRARIVFDTNPAIDTPEWLNTIDVNAPASTVATLPATQTAASFNVQWSGTDIGTGIRDYTIYVSDNGGPFNVRLAQTANTNATFTGVAGHDYRFYSIARDLTGNLENAKTTAEATTMVVSPTADLAVSNSATPSGTVTAGTNLTYTIVVTNNGPSSADSVTLTDTVPVGSGFVSLITPGGWNCTTPAVGSSGTIICTKGSMANGETATFMVVATANCNVPNNTSISSAAVISSVSPADNNSGNNSQTVTRTISNPVPTVSATVATNVLAPTLDHNLVNVGLAATASDGACPAPTAFSVQVFGNEDDQTPTDPKAAAHSPDAKNIGIGTLRLRAERVDSGDGRVYLIIIKTTDAAGGVGFGTRTVVVPKSQSSASLSSVNGKAAAAAAFANANNGNPPAGFFVIGDGPIIGPKQ